MRNFFLKKKHALLNLLRDFISAEVRTQYVVEKHHDWAVVGKGEILPVPKSGEVPLIVSLTTYSHRINDVYLVVESMLRQSVLPNRIILWLDEDEFSGDMLPVLLKKQRQRGLEIMYCKNIRSYKKIIPTLQLTKDCNIITVDDDIIYPYDFIERSLLAYQKNKNCVYYYCGRIILHDGNRFKSYNKWPMVESSTELFDVLPTGAGGVFYPAGCFDDRVTDESLLPDRMSKVEGSSTLSSLSGILNNSKRWPLIALIMMIPLLGIMICILMIFGQAPDAAIKAFTETADFRLSQKIPPQQLYYDEHYLCTVAAGGDRKVVKPLRMGIRHGHPVVVNRQLCVANAFEQVLEERTPRFHKAVRSFYDTHGFPVARLIRTKKAADIVYFIMKPLELVFLIVLYLTDVHPEDRIAMQYTGSNNPICRLVSELYE